jgi:Flp pilus assembly protein TadD
VNRGLAVLLGIAGAFLCAISLIAAHWLSVVHISVREEIVIGIIAAIGFLLMIAAFISNRSGAVIAAEALSLLVIGLAYRVMLTSSARSPQKRTMADMFSIATALEARATDVDQYPTTRNIDDLARYIEPTYIKAMPRHDGYRNTFRYEAWQINPHAPGPDHYAIASAARDWKWEKRSLREYSERATTNFDCDIVFSDGVFVSYPEGFSNDRTTPSRASSTAQPQQTTTDPKALFEHATSLYRVEHFGEAIPLFEQYLQKNPNDALANARIGICLGESGRLQESIPYLLKASALDATDYQSRSNLGLIYEKLNRPEEGIDWERQADKIKPNDPGVLNNLGWVLMRAGHNAEAVTIFGRAVKLAPKEKLYRTNLDRARKGER